MPKLKFNDLSIQRLKAPATGQSDYWDTLLPGFGCRITYKGTKTWMVNVRTLANGEWSAAKRIRVGRYPDMTLSDARKAAAEAMKAARTGNDPGQIERRQKAEAVAASRATFKNAAEDFIRDWVEARGLRPSTAFDYRATLLGQDVEDWQSRPVASITRRDVKDKLAEIAATRPVRANRYLAYWSRFFGWCLENDRIEANPTNGIKKPSAERSRERVLSFEEIGEILAALDERNILHRVFWLLLLTGQRRDEIAGLRWSEIRDIDGAEARIELPGERTKNHRPHIVPLSSQAVALIKAVPRIKDCEYVFSTTGETPVSGYSRAKRTLDGTIAVARKKAKQKPMPGWALHDFRRTMSTHMHEALGIEPHVVEAVLNHVSGTKAGVAGVYNRASYLPQRRVALQSWADRLSVSLEAGSQAARISFSRSG